MRNLRVLIIDKCQDCRHDDCHLRTLVGAIPHNCPLWTIAQALDIQDGHEEVTEWKEYADKKIV